MATIENEIQRLTNLVERARKLPVGAQMAQEKVDALAKLNDALESVIESHEQPPST